MLLINPHKAGRLFWLLFGFTILTVVGMQITGKPLITDIAPGGIVTFELVGSLEGSRAIIDSWQGPAMTWAGINMGLDFLFLTLYGVTIALGCLLVANKLPENFVRLKQVGIWVAYGILFAAVLDVVENVSLIALLTGSTNATLPVVAKWCAIPKFLLVLLSALYVIGGLVPVLLNKK